ncbi:MAG: pyruvate ferredoxin oxidoreductase [Nitrospirae bacterium]|nr:pyruvate ferredoxin oxidoreductase [Nitrospirota bacterium]
MATGITLKELSKKEELLTGGHRMCSGCGAPIIVKMVLLASDYPIIAANATGCLEVSTCISDYTAWKIPWIHQSLSGAMERGHDMIYICYDNGAYMNTGIQRSSATPFGADTTTCPAGSVIPGKTQQRKNLTKIMAAHDIPYAAQASPSHWMDLVKKVKKALDIKGPKFMNVLSPCNRGWRSRTDDAIMLSRLGVETCYWPLYEIEDGVTKVTFKPREKKPLADFLKPQGRFKHMFAPENEWMLKRAQEMVDKEWGSLLKAEAK